MLDFAFVASRLVIEIDGETHALPAQIASDAARDTWLRKQGWRVLRFTNRDVLGNLEGVLITIASTLAPHPGPLPKGEGEDS